MPDLACDAVKMSSIVVGTDLQAAARRNDRNPLVVDGRELVPNVTHAVSKRQHLYFYYEVYDPALAPAIRVVTAPVVATALNGSDRKGVRFQFDVPPASLPVGLYTCQVNVVDDASGVFTFPRLQLFVKG